MVPSVILGATKDFGSLAPPPSTVVVTNGMPKFLDVFQIVYSPRANVSHLSHVFDA